MSKKISFQKEEVLSGIRTLAKSVTSTLGPFGKNVLYVDEEGKVTSTKDGVTVAKNISLNDFESIGAELIKQAAIKVANSAGDGTTSTTEVAWSLIEEGLKVVNEKTNLLNFRTGINDGIKDTIEYLKSISTEITADQVAQVAAISANNNPEIGELVSKALELVGKDGVVSIEESKSSETTLDTVEGIQFDRGYKSHYFVTNNQNMTCVLNDPYILLVNKKINLVKELLPLLERVSQEDKALLIIAEDIDNEALSALVFNKSRGVLKVCAVKAPDFGDRRTAIMEDIAILTGATVIDEKKGMSLDKFDINWLGKSNKAVIGKEQTTIIDGAGSEENINARISDLQSQFNATISSFDKEHLQTRLAKMVGGVAVIYVGGMNEMEMRDKKDLIEDSLSATKSALAEGILPGGGLSYLKAYRKLKNNKSNDEDYNKGYKIVMKALLAPQTRLLTNAGYIDTDIESVIENILTKKDQNIGYNVMTGKYENLLNTGVIDPLKVNRLVLENAASVAIVFLNSSTFIINKEETSEQ